MVPKFLKNMLSSPISMFRNYYDTEPMAEISIGQFCDYVRNANNNDFVEQIHAIRHPDTTGKEQRELKAKLPAVTISGTFSQRNTNGLQKYSGYICLDVDQKGNPQINDWSEIRNEMMDVLNVLFSALSVSGRGIFLIIPIAYPEKHLQHFNHLRRDFKKELQIEIDPACSNVSRLRGISHDPDAKFNADALKYEGIADDTIKYTELESPAVITDFDRLMDVIINLQRDITSDYHNWFRIGCALANEYGEAGRYYFHMLSQFYPKYSNQETDRQFNKCLKYKSGYSLKTIFYIADLHGVNLSQL